MWPLGPRDRSSEGKKSTALAQAADGPFSTTTRCRDYQERAIEGIPYLETRPRGRRLLHVPHRDLGPWMGFQLQALFERGSEDERRGGRESEGLISRHPSLWYNKIRCFQSSHFFRTSILTHFSTTLDAPAGLRPNRRKECHTGLGLGFSSLCCHCYLHTKKPFRSPLKVVTSQLPLFTQRGVFHEKIPTLHTRLAFHAR